ncbi:MAG: peptidyl-prolyl cis-trans isomerase [Gammaproteobacteria bacterium]|nr:peptidyl-prolyl cis-trans isomerase [Gammaproteobacteria bacterium]
MNNSTRWADIGLLIAVVSAIALALSGIASYPAQLPSAAVASVNGVVIDNASLQAYLDQLATQLKRAPGPDERAEVLTRFIGEELLLQQGLALDLPRKDSRLRAQIVQEVIRQAVAVTARQAIDEQELQAFYDVSREYFRRAPLFRVVQYDCADQSAVDSLRQAFERGESESLPRAGVTRNDFLPDAWLPEGKLRDYLGSELAAGIAALAPGQMLIDSRADAPPRLLRMLDVQAAQVPPLATIRAQVEAEFRRRRDEAALDEYMQRLRAGARVQLASDGG